MHTDNKAWVQYGGMLSCVLENGGFANEIFDDVLFVDRDGVQFRHVFEYLRGSPEAIVDVAEKGAMKREFGFYGLKWDDSWDAWWRHSVLLNIY